MTDNDKLSTPRWRFWGERRPPKNRAEMFRVENAAAEDTGSSSSDSVATIRMYGPIDSWGGFWGISAKDVAAALEEVGDDVSEILVRVNSPGGEVWEGMAILNLLRAHRAKVTMVVDGIAASAASFIVAGADERVMSPGTQMMVHDASAFAIGNAATMEKARKMLDSVSDSIASIYAEATGSDAEEWRAVMREETWYTAAETVEAGLADRVAVIRDEGETATAGDDADPMSDDFEDAFEQMVAARFDLSTFTYAGRAHAPAPKTPGRTSAGGSTPTHGTENAMAFTPEQLTTMRQTLGLPEDADEATITAALVEHAQEAAEATSGSVATPPAQPVAPAAPVAPVVPAAAGPQPGAPAAAATPGTMVIDVSAWDAIQERTKRLEAADAKRRRDERDQVIDRAVRDGKFPVARKEHWVRLWDADPEGTRNVVDGLTKNVVPIDEVGHGIDDDSVDDEFAHLFPPTQKGA